MHQTNPNRLSVPPSHRDHYQGVLHAPVILVEYGNYPRPECGQAHQLIQTVQQHFNSAFSEESWLCVVFRHFIESPIHPQARKAAQAAEAAAAQGQFWQMHNILFEHQQELGDGYLVEYADRLGLDIYRFLQDIYRQEHVDRINQDTKSGLHSGVVIAPALFINGIRYIDNWSIEQLMAAITSTGS